MSNEVSAVATAHGALKAHTARYPLRSFDPSTAENQEHTNLYARWITARWDAGDAWVRSVWTTRPEVA